MSGHNIFTFKFNEMYELYLAKVTRKDRTKEELVEVIVWLTGYTREDLQVIDESVTMEQFFMQAPNLNPNRLLISGAICGIKIQEMEESLMKEIRYLDKLVDELAKGKEIDKILRK